MYIDEESQMYTGIILCPSTDKLYAVTVVPGPQCADCSGCLSSQRRRLRWRHASRGQSVQFDTGTTTAPYVIPKHNGGTFRDIALLYKIASEFNFIVCVLQVCSL